MSDSSPIKLAIIWHMHQPDYRDPWSKILHTPWVRLHALKDYLDMLETPLKYDNIRVTFNLVPSLLEQLEHYISGGTDSQLELLRKNPSDSDDREKRLILENSFKCNVERMIKPYDRYNLLYEKWQNRSELTEQEIRDAQVWSNLTWIDPSFRNDPQINSLFDKHELFSEQDKNNLIQWQIEHIKKIVPAYKEALNNDRIEISFSPYFHPILPLLCDSNSAKEALTDIKLPEVPFRHPEDARKQIQMSMQMFENLFGKKQNGMWPSEGSISDEVLNLCAESNIKWIAGDEQVLYRSLQKSEMDTSTNHPYSAYEHQSGVKMLFRDHMLSDKIGFVYSTWDPADAADDFIAHIKSARARLSHLSGDFIVPVILDGENAWEYFPNDGNDFLNALYKKLSKDPEIETVTMSQATEQSPAAKIKSVFAGSWINHNFRIWIGHPEDNTAWTLLKRTRDYLNQFQNQNPDFDKEQINSAWRHIYIAEGSDWFWWYGDEHRGADNHIFDNLFRSNLIRVYELLGATAPEELRIPITYQKHHQSVQLPDALVTPEIDGRISHFYEWFGAGLFHCMSSDTTMHRVFKLVSAIRFGFDHDNFNIRADFSNPETLQSVTNLRIVLTFELPETKKLELNIGKTPFSEEKPQTYKCSFDDIFELAVSRKFLWTESFGMLAFSMELYDSGQLLERWPEDGLIKFELPEKHKELFWHQ